MKDFSFPKARGVWPTYGMVDKNDPVQSKSTVILGLSIVIVPHMCVSSMSIVCFDITLGFVQGEDADDFNPDRFLGDLPAELATDTKNGASFFLYMTSLLQVSDLRAIEGDPFIFPYPWSCAQFHVYTNIRARNICKFSITYPGPSCHDEFCLRALDQGIAAIFPRQHLNRFKVYRRMCPGRYMANNALFISIATILWAADISAVKDEAGKPIIPNTFEFVNSGLVV